MAAPILLTRETVTYKVDKSETPRLEIQPGTELMIETHDARAGRLKRPEQVMETAPDFRDKYPKSNPATGPIRVIGAEPETRWWSTCSASRSTTTASSW